MGWYLRKSLGFGPLRINLSKSGLGGSVGVKGFRVGSGPRGPYLHAGRGGFYYRTSLTGRGDSPEATAEQPEPTTEPHLQGAELPAASGAAPPATVTGANQFGVRLLRGLLAGLMRR